MCVFFLKRLYFYIYKECFITKVTKYGPLGKAESQLQYNTVPAAIISGEGGAWQEINDAIRNRIKFEYKKMSSIVYSILLWSFFCMIKKKKKNKRKNHELMGCALMSQSLWPQLRSLCVSHHWILGWSNAMKCLSVGVSICMCTIHSFTTKIEQQ